MTVAKKSKTKPDVPQSAPLILFKGFDANFQCRDFQFAVGETYKIKGAVKLCNNGFHACSNPLDVWNYYGPCDTRYALVESGGNVDRANSDDTKIASTEITIIAELKLREFIERAVDYLIGLAKTGNNDDHSDSSKLAAAGHYSQLAASGDSSKLAAAGHYSQLVASGYHSQLAASGYYSQLAASGYHSQLAASGYSSKLKITGQGGVAAIAAPNGQVCGAVGTWISIAEFDSNNKCVGFVSCCIGENGTKPNIWYRAEGGKLVEVE